MATTAVRVALRVRPLNAKEQAADYQECITFATDEPRIFLGSDRAFTFDHVFKPTSTQQEVYNDTVAPLVDRYIEGNNVTILAYGQTGSGKTYSMGTGIDNALYQSNRGGDEGIVHRFAHGLFDALTTPKTNGEEQKEDQFQVYVSFLELYHEDLNDLLEPHREGAETHPSIREALDGSIYWAGVREERVYNAKELLGLLRQGAAYRATGSTDVNAASSRSHAVFSVLLKQQLADKENNSTTPIDDLAIVKRIASKFHFVDLAGSERLKRTIGDRQKEGISINTGLLALGNVISALGDEARKGTHVPYRDSKLTRLLQDSLGGNSHTLMLACVSPSDADYMKSLNTLKYAGRARNIQNRVEINHDYEGSPDELQFLRSKLSQLKMQMSILQKVQNHHPQQQQQQYHQPSSSSDNNNADHHLFIQHQHSQQQEELARMRQYNQETSAELARIQSERDTLLAQISPDHVITEAHPVIRQYAETVEALKLQLFEAHNHLATTTMTSASIAATGVEPLPRSPTSPTTVSTSALTYGNTVHNKEDLYPSHSTTVPGRYGATADVSSSTFIDQRDNMRPIYRPVVTLSGRRQKRKYIPIAQRMKTHSRKRGGDSTNNKSTSSSKDELLRMMELTNGNSMRRLTHSSTHTKIMEDEKERENANNLLFVWSQSRDETVIQDLSGVIEENTLGDMFRSSAEHDHNGNSKDINKTRINTAIDEENSFIINNNESGTSSSSVSCGNGDAFEDSDDELEALAVPTWTNSPRAAQSTNGSTKRESLSWTDSLLDDSDNSVATSRLSSSWTSSSRQHHGSPTSGRRRSKDLLKMLHQVQADLLVKKELVGQLEKSDNEYAQMRSTYEDKLNELHDHIVETEKERDNALRKPVGSSRQPLTSTAATARGGRSRATTQPSSANVMQLRETRQADEVRRLYEQKLKKLSTENQELKRKYTQTNHTLQTARAKAETYVGKMQSEIESLKLEKKQLQKVTKMEADRLKDRVQQYERDIQVLKRKEIAANDVRKKLEEMSENQEQLLKRRNEEVTSMAAQLRQLTTNLRRAATDGVLLNQASLDRILNITTNQRATKTPTFGRRSTPTSQ